MRNKKGQAAMEFLTTYGWAFLVIIVAISGLYYMDVFDFSRAIPASFSLDGKIEAGDAFAIKNDGTGTLQVQIKNNNAQVIKITKSTIIEKALADAGNADNKCVALYSDGDVEVVDGNDNGVVVGRFMDVKFDMDNIDVCGITDNEGKKKTFIVEISYTIGDSTIENTAVGKITTTVATA